MVYLHLMEDTVCLLLVFQDIHSRYRSLSPIYHSLPMLFPKYPVHIRLSRHHHSLDTQFPPFFLLVWILLLFSLLVWILLFSRHLYFLLQLQVNLLRRILRRRICIALFSF